MKKLVFAVAVAAAVVGCKKEAEKFGYRGNDLQEDEPLYFTSASGITNYVPMRIMSVVEKYDFTEEELAVVKAFGVVSPGVPVRSVPEGYRCRSKEPWFSSYAKDGVQVFDLTGTVGFLCHPDADRGVYEVGEAFFSTYHKSVEEAKAALAVRRKLFERNLRPLKYYDFSDSFVTEFRRLRVITIFGRRADGVYACMTSFVDKNLEGCGEWLPLDEQQEMLDSYLFSKAVAAWTAESREIAAANHAAAAKACAERKLALFDAVGLGRPDWHPGGRFAYEATAAQCFAWAKDEPQRATVLADTMKKAAVGFGVTFGEIVTNGMGECFADFRADGTGELFDVCVTVAISDPTPPPADEPCEAAKEGESAEPAESVPPAEPPQPQVTVTVTATERMFGGRKLPAYPKEPQR